MHSFAGVCIFSLHLRPSILQAYLSCYMTSITETEIKNRLGMAARPLWILIGTHTWQWRRVVRYPILPLYLWSRQSLVYKDMATLVPQCIRRIRPKSAGRWRWKSFGDALTLLVRWQEGHPTLRQQFPNVLHWKTYSGSGPAGSDIISRK